MLRAGRIAGRLLPQRYSCGIHDCAVVPVPLDVFKHWLQGVLALRETTEAVVADEDQRLLRPRKGDVQASFVAKKAEPVLFVGTGDGVDRDVGFSALERVDCVNLDIEHRAIWGERRHGAIQPLALFRVGSEQDDTLDVPSESYGDKVESFDEVADRSC